MRHRIGIVALCAVAACLPLRLATGAGVPDMSAFSGTWRLASVIGASEGGVTGTDPKSVLGKTIAWSESGLRSPEHACQFRHPAVSEMANHALETSIWGGQKISELSLSRVDIAKAFGPRTTPVFQDESGCAYAVMIDHDHLIFEMGSGWIYRLDRTSG